MVLGGLTEGVWPPETRADPWLSRPMRQALGLDLPERRIGLSAHDFAQALGAKEVVLTRAARVAGAPTVASRFVQRLAAVAGEARWDAAIERGGQYLGWARQLDRPAAAPRPIARPEPKPPREARPSSLSVTEIETLLRDPYSIYARHVLRLRPLDAVDTPLGARDRGTVIHEAVGDLHREICRRSARRRGAAELIRIGEQAFAGTAGFPRRAGVLVAALPAHRALARAIRGGAAATHHQAARRNPRHARNPARRPRLHAAHPRRPH